MKNSQITPTVEGASSRAAHGSAAWCGLKDDPTFAQCCCNCKHLHPVYYHCCTEPKPTDEQKKAAGIEGRCVCGVQKGWACHNPEMDGRIYDNWPQHSCGCECYDPKSPRLVGLVANHLPGDGCMCSAWNDSECGCPNVDWRSRREVALEKALEYCLKKLKAHHRSRTGIPETIRNTEAIRDAGTRQPNAEVSDRPS